MKLAVILRTGVLGGIALAALGVTPVATFAGASRLVDPRTALALAMLAFTVLGCVGAWWLHRRSMAQAAAERAGQAGLGAVLAGAGYRLADADTPLSQLLDRASWTQLQRRKPNPHGGVR